MILFDTDICLQLLAGKEKIRQQFGSVLEEVCVAAPCVQELFLAVEESSNPEANRRTLDKFLATVRVLYPDAETYRYAARLQKKLAERGSFAPVTDVLIYSLSRIHSARLVTLHARRYRFT